MSIQVGIARRKYGIPYPTLYAVPGTPREYGPEAAAPAASAATPLTAPGSADAAATADAKRDALVSSEEAYKFNCVQRGHQNSLENMPVVATLALVSWSFPIPAGFALISYAFSRIFYMRGYTSGASKRNSVIGALLTYPALFTLAGLSLATAIFYFRGTAAYSY
jgi:hypothetical protein